jgi:hypothetical protein
MLYQLFEQAIVTIKKTEPDQEALHIMVDNIIREIMARGSTESSLKLLKYLFIRVRRNHSSYTFFSDSTQVYLRERFYKDPSNFSILFIYALSIPNSSEKKHLLLKITNSAWIHKCVAVETLKELKVYE